MYDEPDAAKLGALIEAERALQKAQLESDVDKLELLLHDQLRNFIGPDTHLHGKADDLESHRSRVFEFKTSSELEMDAQVLGETGITTALLELDVELNGQPVGGNYRYIRTWVFDDDRWQIVGGAVVAATDSPGPH
jgi:hypothetical protein